MIAHSLNFGTLNKVIEMMPIGENNFKYGVRHAGSRLFNPVIGFQDLKEIFQLSINADKPVNIDSNYSESVTSGSGNL